MPEPKILIVDDEPPARRKVRTLLSREAPAAEVREAGSVEEAIRAIRDGAPDLVFLDIQMPGGTGFDVIEGIGAAAMPAVVFVTAYDQFAVRAFEVEAVDYLLKPFDADRFRAAWSRARSRLARPRGGDAEALARILAEIGKPREYLRRILVSRGSKHSFVRTADIRYFEAQDNYVAIHAGGEPHLIRESLASLESRLDPDRFVRIHRSIIVQIDQIGEIQPWAHGDAIVILRDGRRLTLSRRFRGRIFPER